MDRIVPGILATARDARGANAAVRIEALSLLGRIVQTHRPELLQSQATAMVAVVVAACGGDTVTKITVEALRLAGDLAAVISPAGADADAAAATQSLFAAIIRRLQQESADQETREQAIMAAGSLVVHHGDTLPAGTVAEYLRLVMGRLQDGQARLAALRALESVVHCKWPIDLSPVVAPLMGIVTGLLRKSDRMLRLAGLCVAVAVVERYRTTPLLDAPLKEAILAELPSLFSDADLQMAQMALTLLSLILSAGGVTAQALLMPAPGAAARGALAPAVGVAGAGSIMASLLSLVHSPLLHGATEESMIAVFQTMCRAQLLDLGFAQLVALLLQVCKSISDSDKMVMEHRVKSEFPPVARCIGLLCAVCPGSAAAETIQQFIRELRYANESPKDQVLLALFAIGEIGRRLYGAHGGGGGGTRVAHVMAGRVTLGARVGRDLSAQTDLQGLLIQAFAASSEDVKSAASLALGSIAMGNLRTYLPFLLNEIRLQPRWRYLLLRALREVIVSVTHETHATATIKAYVGPMWELLFEHCEGADEGTDNVIGECLGKLALMDLPATLPPLMVRCRRSPPHACCPAHRAAATPVLGQPARPARCHYGDQIRPAGAPRAGGRAARPADARHSRPH